MDHPELLHLRNRPNGSEPSGREHFDERAITTSETAGAPRLSAKKTIKSFDFFCGAPEAKLVYLTGDFNGWNPDSHAMHRREDGWWWLQVPLSVV